MSDSQSSPPVGAEQTSVHELTRGLAFDAIVTADDRGTITSLNAAAVSLFGRLDLGPLGKPLRSVFSDASQNDLVLLLERAQRGETARHELLARGANGSIVSVEVRVAAVPGTSPASLVVVARDLTRVTTAENELRISDAAIGVFGAEQASLRRIAAAIASGARPDAVFSLVAREAADLQGVEQGTVVRFTGRRGATVVGEWEAEGGGGDALSRRPFSLRQDSSVRRAMRGGVSVRLGARERRDQHRAESVAAPMHLETGIWGALAVSSRRPNAFSDDTTQRLERFASLVAPALVEAEARDVLARQAAEQLALATIGELALRSTDIGTLFVSAVKIVADTLGADRVQILELVAGDTQLEIRGRSGRRRKGAATARIPVSIGTRFGLAMVADVPVVVEDASGDERFAEAGAGFSAARSSISISIRTRDDCWGILDAESNQPGHFGQGDPVFLRGVANVLSSAIGRALAEELIRHQAMHDPLTGIANRTLLSDRLAVALERAGRARGKVAVMIIEIDHFKTVNDTLGHTEGDAILIAIARRLSDVLRPGDTAARLGGDEFAVLYESVSGERETVGLAEAVVRLFRPQHTLTEGVALTASVGVVLRGAGDSAEVALRDAHTAAYRAKANGRDRFEVFDASMRTRLVERRSLENDLRRAIEQDELVAYYQPIVAIEHGLMDGVEALVRWNHPERGLLGPREFVAIAEETGLIVPLGLKMLEYACRDASGWNARTDTTRPLRISVNLSTLQIAEPTVVDDVTEIAQRWELPAGQLGLEITESVVLDDNQAHLERLAAVRAAGIRIILDDFGTGYSSLSYLRHFPLDVLKLDRSFVTGIGDDPGAAAIVAAVTQMAAALELPVVAEGVETASELRTVARLGCKLVQGYFFARPMALAKLERLLDAPPPWLSRGRAQGPA